MSVSISARRAHLLLGVLVPSVCAWVVRAADARADQVCATASDCEDGIACTGHTCDAVLGCQTSFDDTACDDANACTIDDCDLDGCHHAVRPDDTIVASGVACEAAGMCSAALGERVCEGGVEVVRCPGFVDTIVDLGDDVCSAREVAYAIVADTVTGAPVGTVRCWREVVLGSIVVDCDRESPGSNQVKVHAALLCPGDL